MLIFFLLFSQLITLLMGIYILSDRKIGIKNFWSWLVIIQIIGQILYIKIDFFAIFFVLLFLIICLIMKTKQIFLSILITCFPLVVLVVTNYFSQVIEMYVVKDFLVSFSINYAKEVVCTILTSIFTILICCLTKYLMNKFRRLIVLERKYKILMLIFLLLMIVIFYVNIFIGQIQGFSQEHITLTSILFFIYACLLCGVYVALIYTLNKESKMKQERVLNQQLHDYTLKIEQLYNNLNSFRHDYLNLLVSLEEGIRLEDIEIVKGIYNRVIKPTEQMVKSNHYILGKLNKIHIIEIKSLLAEKIVNAQTKGIDVRLEIEDIIDIIYMDLFSFYRVISILLDNAIEAADGVSDSYISIVFIQDRELQRIEVENTCQEQEINLKDIYKKGYSSKGSNRGTGLYNVQQILNENKYSTLETFCELGVFTQTLILKREGKKIMNVFILEDDTTQRIRLEKMIKEALEKHSILYKKIFSTSRPIHLLNEINFRAGYHIYFLDLEINNHSRKGLEIAQLIRQKDSYGTIVFVTTHSELAPKTFAYKVSALDFIEKDQSDFEFRKRIEECLMIANQYQKKTVSDDYFIFENKYTKFQIPFSEILYFETSEIPHKINLVTSKKNISFYGKLSEIINSDNRLARCHKSFVVNICNITSIDKKNKIIYFKNNMHCFVSRRLLKEVENKVEELSIKNSRNSIGL